MAKRKSRGPKQHFVRNKLLLTVGKLDALKILSFQDDKEGISANPCQDQPDLTLACLWMAPGVLHHIMDQAGVLELVLMGLDARWIGAVSIQKWPFFMGFITSDSR